MLIENELQHFCCGPKGCQLEIDSKWRKRQIEAKNTKTENDNRFLDIEF